MVRLDLTNVSVGDEVIIPHKEYGNIPFIIIGVDHDAPNSVTLLTKEIIRCLAFDAREPENNSSNEICSYGNSNYKYSNLLQWLNSDKKGGEWYSAQHIHDQEPSSDYIYGGYNPYNNIDGLLRGFSSDIIDRMIEVSKPTALCDRTYEDVKSKVFLLSRTEVGLDSEDIFPEGKIYAYFKNNSPIACIGESALIHDQMFEDYDCVLGYMEYGINLPWGYFLRTPYEMIGVESTPNVYTPADPSDGRIGVRFALTLRRD